MLVILVSVANVAFIEPRHSTQLPAALSPRLRLRRMVEPIYPEAALENGIGGTVVVEVLIDKQGVPQAIHAIRGNPLLATTAYEAVQQWRWKPFRLNRVPIAVEMTIAMDFGPELAAI